MVISKLHNEKESASVEALLLNNWIDGINLVLCFKNASILKKIAELNKAFKIINQINRYGLKKKTDGG